MININLPVLDDKLIFPKKENLISIFKAWLSLPG